MTRKSKTAPMSLRAYARHRRARGLVGTTPEAVSKAVADGRLSESVVRVRGQPKIRDAEAADREWESNTKPRVDQRPHPAARARGATESELPPGIPDYYTSRALREAAAARREAALADMAELEAAKMRGDLVEVAKARADVMDRYAVVRTRLLGVPVRAKQRLPHLTASDVHVLDDLVREALDELATGGVADDVVDDDEDEERPDGGG